MSCGCEKMSMDEMQEELCKCPGGMSEKFLEPCLLLLLHQNASYGYSLLEELGQLGLSTDASVIYRNLRRMEREELVKSHWDTQGSGPAKRNYTITKEGEDLLHSWVATIKKNKGILEHFLKVYESRFNKQPVGKIMKGKEVKDNG